MASSVPLLCPHSWHASLTTNVCGHRDNLSPSPLIVATPAHQTTQPGTLTREPNAVCALPRRSSPPGRLLALAGGERGCVGLQRTARRCQGSAWASARTRPITSTSLAHEHKRPGDFAPD